MTDWHVSLAQIMEKLERFPDGKRYHYPIRHGSMRVGIYAPEHADPQTPHAQDEIYIVISGTGTFVKHGEERQFGPGDVLFVEARVEHSFKHFTKDFATWVIFWGPEGGEG